jgi:hypothetical protein
MHLCDALQANQKSWMSDPLDSIDGEAVEKDMATAYKVLYKMGKVSRRASSKSACSSHAAQQACSLRMAYRCYTSKALTAHSS